jgi:hypothetical protein
MRDVVTGALALSVATREFMLDCIQLSFICLAMNSEPSRNLLCEHCAELFLKGRVTNYRKDGVGSPVLVVELATVSLPSIQLLKGKDRLQEVA